MNPFTMHVEYLDSETGELVTNAILIDDFPILPAELFLPESNNNSEYPW